MVSEWSSALLFAWTGLVCLAALTEMFLPKSGKVLEDGEMTSERATVRDFVAAPVPPLVSPEETTRLIEVYQRMSGKVLENDSMMPSGGGAVRDCVTVPSSSPVPSEETTKGRSYLMCRQLWEQRICRLGWAMRVCCLVTCWAAPCGCQV